KKRVKSGDKVPSSEIYERKQKKDTLFGVPGAFTPSCTKMHPSRYMEKALENKAVEVIACLFGNDAFVINELGKALQGFLQRSITSCLTNNLFRRCLGQTDPKEKLQELGSGLPCFLPKADRLTQGHSAGFAPKVRLDLPVTLLLA
uniref:thioredoxin-dependent peroxiredoxin n=1 Tax=Naja naja TaxID=35670 RepID=A0A8C6Y808_NAJNA